ncbi:MAG: M48 family metallopeptidase [Candidatus Acidiferrales bacterium]|jgi:predicted Zn-dependent protease
MKSWMREFAAILLAMALVYPAAYAQQQQAQAPPAQTPQPAQTQPQQSQTTPPADAAPAQDTTQTQDTGPTPSGVKGGSEADVNAIGNRKVGHGLDMYSMEHEIALGKQLAQEVDRVSKFITDPVVTEYVNRVGQNLVRNSDAQVPFTIKVIDSDTVNAFALPGGFFYVNSGLILRADEESELAGVMAHEIAHVCARHGTRNATKGTIMQMATIPLILLGPGGWTGYGIYEGLNFLIPITYLKFSRDAEREADYLGLQYMYKAGYDPNAFVQFFEKVEADEKKHPGTIPKLFSTHPPTPDRIEASQKAIATILPSREEYIVSTSEFDVVKRRLGAIEAGQKVQEKKVSKDKPTLRKRTDPNAGGTATTTNPDGTSTNGDSTTNNGDSTSSDDDRPVLKKRPD